MKLDEPNEAEALSFLAGIDSGVAAAAVFDPQWDTAGGREALPTTENMSRRAEPMPMADMQIRAIVTELDRVAREDGWLVLWCDVHHVLRGSFFLWASGTRWRLCDMVLWKRPGLGLGSLVRRNAEIMLLASKGERVFRTHDVGTVMDAPRPRTDHPHAKPAALIAQVLAAITDPGDLVVDPAAGSYAVLRACQESGRRFLGCDLRSLSDWSDEPTGVLFNGAGPR